MDNNFNSGKVIHNREFKEGGEIQIDSFKVKISLDCLTDEGYRLLSNWCVEELDSASIDWLRGEIILEYTTEHYLPSGYADKNELEDFEVVV